MFDFIKKLFTAVSILELLIILVARIVEVSIGTLRVILVNKGYRVLSSILAFIEVLIWVLVASRVIVGIQKSPIKVFDYSLGYALGVYVGSIIEAKVALGTILVQAIVPYERGINIATELRSEGYGVTTIDAFGMNSKKCVLMIYTKRRRKDKVIKRIMELDNEAVIVSNELSTIQGGYLPKANKFLK